MSRRSFRAALAGATALTLVMAPTAATATDDTPTEPLEVRESSNSVGQSVQIRTDADGNPNSATSDFRWAATQIGAQGEPGTDITVSVPEQGLLLHNLQEFGRIPQVDGYGQYDISLNDTGFGTARSVSLVPPEDFELPVELTTEFTLDGEPVLAQDLVGKDGVVTAKYTVINRTREEVTVPITSVTGDEVEKSVEADVPMVVEATTLLPDRFSALNTGTGLGGADGRGNTQVKWIALPFAPLSEDGTASFGWAANVTDAVIPSMLVQVLPLYIPPGAGEQDPAETAEEVAQAGEALGVPPPNVSEDLTAVKAGLEDVLEGLATLTEDDGGQDPLTTIEESANAFFEEFGEDLQTVATLVDPNNPDGATALVKDLQAQVDGLVAQLAELEASGALEKIDSAAAVLTPEVAEKISGLVDYADEISFVADNAAQISFIADSAETIQFLADNAQVIQQVADNAEAIASFIKITCRVPSDDPTITEICNNKDAIIAILEDPRLQDIAAALNSEAFQDAADIVSSEQFQKAADLIASDEFQQAADVIASDEFAEAAAVLPDVAAALVVLEANLAGVINTLQAILPELDSVLAALEESLTGLSTSLETIAQGVAEKDVDLPTLDAVVASITEQVLNSPGGQQVTSGLDQISTGASGVKSEMAAYVAELTVALTSAGAAAQEAIESGKATAADLIDKADALKAEVGGMVVAAGQSPLPYGGDSADAEEGTKLSGAYEFRMDPADTEAPSTLPRILLGLVLLLVAGFVGGRLVTQRSQGAAATAGGGSSADGADSGGPVGGGSPAGSDSGGSAAGVATAAAGMGATAVALADDDPGEATAALPGDAAEGTDEAADTTEGALADSADQAQGDAAGAAQDAPGPDLPGDQDGGDNTP